MTDGPTPPSMPNILLIELMQRQQKVEAALGQVITLLKDTGGLAARSMSGTTVALFAVLELLIRKDLITTGEAITSIDGLMAERFGEESEKIEQAVVDDLLRLLQDLKSKGR